MVVARVGHRDALNDQAPVAHDHAAVLVVAQRSSLGLIEIRHTVQCLIYPASIFPFNAHFTALVERQMGSCRTLKGIYNEQ